MLPKFFDKFEHSIISRVFQASALDENPPHQMEQLDTIFYQEDSQKEFTSNIHDFLKDLFSGNRVDLTCNSDTLQQTTIDWGEENPIVLRYNNEDNNKFYKLKISEKNDSKKICFFNLRYPRLIESLDDLRIWIEFTNGEISQGLFCISKNTSISVGGRRGESEAKYREKLTSDARSYAIKEYSFMFRFNEKFEIDGMGCFSKRGYNIGCFQGFEGFNPEGLVTEMKKQVEICEENKTVPLHLMFVISIRNNVFSRSFKILTGYEALDLKFNEKTFYLEMRKTTLDDILEPEKYPKQPSMYLNQGPIGLLEFMKVSKMNDEADLKIIFCAQESLKTVASSIIHFTYNSKNAPISSNEKSISFFEVQTPNKQIVIFSEFKKNFQKSTIFKFPNKVKRTRTVCYNQDDLPEVSKYSSAMDCFLR